MNTISRPSPNHGGLRSATRGVILHSTRGGASTVEQEFAGTLNWFANPASQVSAHDVIAADGTLAFVVDDELTAWHAGIHNNEWLGIELVQPRLGDPFTDAQFKTLGERLRYLSAKFGFLLDAEHLPFHSQVQQGIASGKSDAVPRNDQAAIDAFRAALGPYLLEEPPPPPANECAELQAEYDHLHAQLEAWRDARPFRAVTKAKLKALLA